MRRILHRLVFDETAQDLIEYALLVSLIATVSIAALGILGDKVHKWMADVIQAL